MYKSLGDCTILILKCIAMLFATGDKNPKLFLAKARGEYSLINADSQRGLRCSLRCQAMQLCSSATFHLNKVLLRVEEAINFSKIAGLDPTFPNMIKIKTSYMVVTFDFQ